MKLKDLHNHLIKTKKGYKEEYEKPDDFYEPGSYFTFIRSDGRGSRKNEHITRPCKAVILSRNDNILTVIIDEGK